MILVLRRSKSNELIDASSQTQLCAFFAFAVVGIVKYFQYQLSLFKSVAAIQLLTITYIGVVFSSLLFYHPTRTSGATLSDS
jgi:uncharacterized membrane protein